MEDDLLELLHGLGAGEPPRVYGRARAAAHRLHRVHVFGVAHGLVVPDAPALGVSILTVVFVSLRVPRRWARRGVLQNGFFMQLLLKRRVKLRRERKNTNEATAFEPP